MGDSKFYIRTGFGPTLISEKRPVCIPIMHSLVSIKKDLQITIKGSIELGLLSKDNFFLDIDTEITTSLKAEDESILAACDQGENRAEILKAAIIEHFRELFKSYKFTEIESNEEEISASLSKVLQQYGIERSKIDKLLLSRTGLDDYDLENIIHFETAKDIVTRIARVQIKDKDFIDKCRKTISHFDIVDE